jgi:hypothetical protein
MTLPLLIGSSLGAMLIILGTPLPDSFLDSYESPLAIVPFSYLCYLYKIRTNRAGSKLVFPAMQSICRPVWIKRRGVLGVIHTYVHIFPAYLQVLF